MTNEEDYLDGLLSSITQKKSDIEEQKSREESDLRKKYDDRTRLSPDDDFLKETGLSDYRPSAVDRKNLRQAFSESGFLSDFEKTLNDGTADDFIRDFERELEDDELSGSNSEAELSEFLDDEKKPEKAVPPSSPQSADQENFNLDISSPKAPVPEISTNENPDEQLLSNIDEIVKNAKKQVEEGVLVPRDEDAFSTPPAAENTDVTPNDGGDDDGMSFVSNLDIFSDGPSNDPPFVPPSEESITAEPDLSGGIDESALSAASELENLFPEGDTSAKEVPLMDEEGADQDLLNILGSDGEFSDIGDLLTADANQEALPESTAQFEEKVSSVSPGGDGNLDTPVSEEDGGKKKKGGFLGKLKGIFKKKKKGGEEAEASDDSNDAVPSAPVNINPINPSAEELSSETDSLLAEFGELPESSGTEAKEEAKEEEDGKKGKRGKKKKGKKGKDGGEEGEEGGKDKGDDKAEKKKKAAEKKAAKKAAKEAEKAADTSPVIPRKAIIVFAIFGISVAVFVNVLSKSISSKLLFSAAEAAYNKGEYNEAYTKFSGLELKGDDVLYLDRSRILGTLDLHLKQYEVAMKYKKYDMALDSLIMGMESYEKNKEYAAELSISEVYDSYAKRIEEQLSDQFTLSKEDAHNIYNSKSRVEYSIRINRKLRELKLVDDPFKEEAQK